METLCKHWYISQYATRAYYVTQKNVVCSYINF